MTDPARTLGGPGTLAWAWLAGPGPDPCRHPGTLANGKRFTVTFLGLAIFGTWVFVLDGYYLIAPVGLFISAGIFMSAWAVAGLLSGSARDHCHHRAAV
jgi:hypothetical protein